MLTSVINIDDSTRVAEARRQAMAAASREGLGETAAEEVGIISTEMATNLQKHAVLGELHIAALSAAGEAGVEILSIDRGPGMASLQECVRDGFSTAGTPGTGLGAISRLASVFDGFSQLGRGTVIAARRYRNGCRATGERWTFGAVTVPYPGEEICGDNWGIRRSGRHRYVMVADGLGHGVLAADASAAAIAAFQNGSVDSAVSILEDVHRALRSTRGAAVAVTRIEPGGRLQYAGIGNIAGVVLGGARSQYMVSHNGTAGIEARRLQEFEYPLPPNAVIVMHSDGLTTSWSLDAYPGLLRRHPSVIAGILYRDASRGRDDACVLVGRHYSE